MRQYELTIIYPLEEEQFQTGREQVLADFTTNGVEIVKTADPVDRDFAYPINKRNRGRYILYLIKADPSKILVLDRAFKLNQNLVKFLFVKVEE